MRNDQTIESDEKDNPAGLAQHPLVDVEGWRPVEDLRGGGLELHIEDVRGGKPGRPVPALGVRNVRPVASRRVEAMDFIVYPVPRDRGGAHGPRNARAAAPPP